MTAPVITLTGTFKTAAGDPAAGTVTFKLNTPLLDNIGNVVVDRKVIVSTLDSQGRLTDTDGTTPGMVLYCTAGGDIQPTAGVVYEVTEQTGAPTRYYLLALPSSLGSTVDLADLLPVDSTGLVWTVPDASADTILQANIADEATTRATADTAEATARAAADTAEASARAAADALLVAKTGDTMTGPLVLPGNAGGNLQATPLQQVNSLIATAVAQLVNGAPGLLDTLGEIAAALGADESTAATLATTVAGKLAKASNLSDLLDAAAARTNLGLGSAATHPSTDFDAAGAASAAQAAAIAASQPASARLTTLAGRTDATEAAALRTAALDAAYQPIGTYLAAPATVAGLAANPVIAHRGSGIIAPENTMEAFRGALAAGAPGIKVDAYYLSDGSFGVMHDATVDRTTSSSGNTADFSAHSWKSLVIPAGTNFYPAWGNLTPPLLNEVFDEFGGRTVLFIDLKQWNTTSAAVLLAEIVRRKLTASVVITTEVSVTLAGLCAAAGVPYMAYWNTTALATTSPATALAAGATMLGINYTYTDADVTAMVAAGAGAGKPVYGFTITRRYDRDRMRTLGVTGLFSDNAYYIGTDVKIVTSDMFAQRTPSPGLVGATAFTYLSTPNRLYFNNTVSQRYACLGSMCPLATPNAYTISATIDFDTLDTDTTRFVNIVVAATDDRAYTSSGQIVTNGYAVLFGQNGQIRLFRQDAGSTTDGVTTSGASTQIGTTTTTTAVQAPVLSSGLTSGVAITALPVNALAVAVVAGQQWRLPTGQLVTASGTAAIGATSIPVTSVTPSAAVATASVLPPVMRVTIQVTYTPGSPNQTVVLATRLDTAATCTATDQFGVSGGQAYHGGYLHIGKNGGGTGAGKLACSYSSVSVA